VLDQSYSIAEASRSLYVGENVLRRWVMQLSVERGGIIHKSKALTLEQHQQKLAMEVNVYCLSS
jgi:transposase